jgi:hypothetical protein
MSLTKYQLSPEAIAIIDKVIELLKKPEYITHYAQDKYMGHSLDEHMCETECCIAGFMVYAGAPDVYEKLAKRLKGESLVVWNSDIVSEAQRLMGEDIQLYNLFSSGEYWWGEFGERWEAISEKYWDDHTRRRNAQAALAIERLEYFKAQGV